MCDIEQDEIHVNQSFYYIGHFSRFIQRGARRIATTKYTDQLEITAYQNPNGSRVLIILNRTDKLLPVHIKENNNFCRLQSIPHSIQTIVWE
jgi:glucosylceramidase